MKYYMTFCAYLSQITNIELQYIFLILGTIITLVIGFVLKFLGNKIIMLLTDVDEKRYRYNHNYKLGINIIVIILLFFVWNEYIKSLMTLISVLSAAVTIAIRDIIFNWFCGIYIKVKKPFKVEDRILIDGIKGDVVNISSLAFELLEVKDDEDNGQSTGIVISFPNSIVFTKPLKNYTKGFKYIWNEMTIKITLDSNPDEVKKEVYKIINGIEEIVKVPKKMKRQINSINSNYRIYYNNYEPIIYTKIVDSHVELKLRYLMNPKKARMVESIIWNNILDAYQNGIIKLYNEDD